MLVEWVLWMMDEADKHDSSGCLLWLMMQDGGRRAGSGFIQFCVMACLSHSRRSGRETPINEARKPEVLSAFIFVDIKLELNYDWS